MTQPASSAAPAKLPPRWLLKAITRTHVFLNRLTGGRWFNTLGGDEVCFVTMTGAKSGRTITNPLMYVPYGEGVLLVASQGGAPKNPVWYNNLVKTPAIEVRHRGRLMRLRARLAAPEEKPALWPVCDARYGPLRRLPRPHQSRHPDLRLRTALSGGFGGQKLN